MAHETNKEWDGNELGCPSTDDLRTLLRDENPDEQTQILTDHVGACNGCQCRIEELATHGTMALSAAVRHIDRAEPAKDSEYWRALNQIQGPQTALFGHSSEFPRESLSDLQLDFLDTSDEPGSIGRLGTFEVRR
ncbi:MAG: hypothetical protein LC104_16295, partial [Bacteroidales bacterium]|nr:hypothetical protein [Bacteroidales bacterium]